MNNNDLLKMIANELAIISEKKDIKCLESYLYGFQIGMKKMMKYMMEKLIYFAKEENIELTEELKELSELLQNS